MGLGPISRPISWLSKCRQRSAASLRLNCRSYIRRMPTWSKVLWASGHVTTTRMSRSQGLSASVQAHSFRFRTGKLLYHIITIINILSTISCTSFILHIFSFYYSILDPLLILDVYGHAAWLTCRKRSALAASCGPRSGCSSMASRRYAALISSTLAPFCRPRVP